MTVGAFYREASVTPFKNNMVLKTKGSPSDEHDPLYEPLSRESCVKLKPLKKKRCV